MANDRFLIAPFSSGLVKDTPVWQTPEDSFHKLKNAYVHRGVIKKRFGSKYVGTATSELLGQLKSRLRINIGTTDGSGDISSVADAIPAGSVFKTGQMFSIGSEIFTVPEAGTPVTMLTNGSATTHTYNTTTGAYDIQGSTAATICYFYPTEPVMGLTMFEAGSISDHPAIAFDTRFAYLYTGAGWGRVGTQIYKGDNLNYFWSTNFEGTTANETALFTTNFNADGATSDNMYYTLDKTTWTVFKPKILVAGTADQNVVITAKIMAPFKSRLVLFDTYEYENKGGAYTYKRFVNRARYSSVGNPLHADAFLEAKQVGYIGGGYIDASTEEEIISVQYIKDKLIVYFERSTYELAYTFNDALPFIWQKISSDLGSTSAFSSIPISEGVFTIGATGVNMCNGVQVVRADTKIPDTISKYLKVSAALKRIHGIKEYGEELLYWTIPAQRAEDAEKYPDKILVYNYSNKSWATYDDSITCFGYFEQTLADTWEDDYQTWEDDTSTWEDAEEVQGHRRVIAGNQHGFVFALSNTDNSNAPVLQVSKISGITVTVNEHNLSTGDYIKLHNSGVAAQDIIYKVFDTPTDDTIKLIGLDVPAYGGGATLSRVSNISIKSTAWNPYNTKGKNISLSKIIFCVKKTTNGEITVNFVPSQANLDMISQGLATFSNLGTNILETFPYELVPLESEQDLLWHSVYFQAEGNSVQIHITYSESQMLNESIVMSDFEVQGIILETSPSGDMG